MTLKARTADTRRTEAALARLQEPLARRLALPGTVPAWTPEAIGGLNAFTLRVTPELAPTYAVADGGTRDLDGARRARAAARDAGRRRAASRRR